MPTADARPRSLERTVRLRARADGASLEPGRDLAVAPPVAHVHDLPFGTLLDDHLEAADRHALEVEAQTRYERWSRRHADRLTEGCTDLGWVWGPELLTEVFFPEVVTVAGLGRVLARHPELERLELVDLDAELGECLTRVLGVPVTPAAAPSAVPSYPRRVIEPRPLPAWQRLYRVVRETAGVPPWPRGDVLVLPYRSLDVLRRRMEGEAGLVPIQDPRSLPPLPPRELAAALRRGGWIGSPSGLALRRCARSTARLLAALPRTAPADDALDALLERRAARLLDHRARHTFAHVASIRSGLLRARARGVLLAWDSPSIARTAVAAARQAEVPVVVVQHGFVTESQTPDKTVSDAAAVWSAADAATLSGRAHGLVVVTGNPGGEVDVSRAPAPRTVILPEYPGFNSLAVGDRATARSVETALAALESTRPGTVAVVRPHPADYDAGGYETLAPRHPGIRLEVDARSPIEHVLARADLCIGTVSTATLQAARAGVPVIFLDVAVSPRMWPFDHSGAIPTAVDQRGLEALIPRVLAGRESADPEAVRAALGLVPDATERVLALMRETFAAR